MGGIRSSAVVRGTLKQLPRVKSAYWESGSASEQERFLSLDRDAAAIQSAYDRLLA